MLCWWLPPWHLKCNNSEQCFTPACLVLCFPVQMRRTSSWRGRPWTSWTGVWTSWRPSRPTAPSARWPPTRCLLHPQLTQLHPDTHPPCTYHMVLSLTPIASFIYTDQSIELMLWLLPSNMATSMLFFSVIGEILPPLLSWCLTSILTCGWVLSFYTRSICR